MELFVRVNLRFEDSDVREVAVQLGVIETIADHEFIGYIEAQVIDAEGDCGVTSCRFVEQGTDAHAGRLALGELRMQIGQRQAAVDNVFDNQHVFARNIHIEVFEESDNPIRMGAAPVARGSNEVNRERQVDVTSKVDHKDGATFEDANEDNVGAAAVIVGDEFAQFGDAGFELLFTQEDVRDIVVHDSPCL